ncbi:MAG: hypothetical protein ACM34M_07755 [Ignavibacteria bacterium]
MKNIVSVLLISVFFTGCLNYIQDVQLYPDGSGKMAISYWMPLPSIEGSAMLDKMGIGIFNPDSIKNGFSSPYSTIENIEVFTDSSDTTIHAAVELSFTHIDSLNKTKAFKDSKFSLKDGAAGQKIFSEFIQPFATGFGFDEGAYEVIYKYKFSGDIITHNAVKTEGRNLIWQYKLSEIGSGKTISVTFPRYKLKETPYWIYILSGFVLLVVIIFLFRKKKS